MPHAPLRSRLATAALAAVAALAGGCAEELDGGASCPVLCPAETVPVQDTVLSAVALDTTLAGFPLAGEQPFVLLAAAPGTPALDVRLVARFDSLPRRYLPVGAVDSAAITAVDSGYLRLRLDSACTRATAAVTLEAYDVDTAGVDSAAAGLVPLFRADRRLGAVTVAAAALDDSVRIPIDNAALAAKLAGARRVRIGVLARSAAPAQLRVLANFGGAAGAGPRISFDPAVGGAYQPLTFETTSSTPPGDAGQAFGYRNFSVGASVPGGGDARDLVVGGVAGRRAYLRFDVPRSLLDSVNVVRATLLLTQRPSPGQQAVDTVRVTPDLVVASRGVTDLRRATTLVLSETIARGVGLRAYADTLAASPTTAGAREISVAGVLALWRGQSDSVYQALSLRAPLEGAQASELRFYSREAAAELRPRLRISYVPRTRTGLP